MNQLENFIRQQRDAFDLGAPSPQAWAGIERALGSTDDLEKFVAEQRAFFDAENPSARVWSNIGRSLEGADSLEKFILENRANFDLEAAPHSALAKIEAYGQLGNCAMEEFLTQNRAALDAAVPDLRVWAAIEKSLPEEQRGQGLRIAHINWGRRLMAAAASVTLLLVCFGAGYWYARNDGAAEAMAMSDVSTEYAELEQFYQRDIAGKREKLATFANNQAETVLEDLTQMDKVMEDLQHELADVPPGKREQVVHAMIENYKAKAAILGKVLEHIQAQQYQQPEQSNSVKHEIKNI